MDTSLKLDSDSSSGDLAAPSGQVPSASSDETLRAGSQPVHMGLEPPKRYVELSMWLGAWMVYEQDGPLTVRAISGPHASEEEALIALGELA